MAGLECVRVSVRANIQALVSGLSLSMFGSLPAPEMQGICGGPIGLSGRKVNDYIDLAIHSGISLRARSALLELLATSLLTRVL
jgi:hypothetical protein